MSDIPAEIMKDIQRRATEEWEDDADMRDSMIESETDGYLSLQALDFGPALPSKAAILKEAGEYSELWEERASFAADEISAFATLQNFAADDVPAAFIAEAKAKAAEESDWYSSQLEAVEREIENYRQIERTRAKVTPIRELLQRMERIIGAACYNDNIQNRSWGYLDSTGRQFRYPVTFINPDGTPDKRWDYQDGISPETLITGHYKVGANELNIYRALVQIVDMLQAEYGLQLPAATPERES